VKRLAPATAPKVDGRRERSKRTRAAIVGALTSLLDEGRIEPTAVDIAKRAGVAVRSIAQHFASREELLLAVAAHHTQRLAHEPIDAKQPLASRIEAFVTERARELEASRAMRGAAAVVLARSPGVARALHVAAERRRTETARVFATEIAASADSRATERSLALVTSGRAWDALRTELGMGTKAARDQLVVLLRSVLGR
jgi:TetR/AcrR family transcriptional regulator of autoinduction and epiphytic fitness